MSTPTQPGLLALLAFHKIGPAPGGWETWSYIPEATFADYLRHLREAGWRVLDLAAFLHGLTAPETLPRRSALLTFDDGYRSNLTVAVPWLRRFDCPAVMFVPTDFIGGKNSFDNDIEPEEAICTWDELRELERAGVAVQSHGCSHRAFSDLTPAEQQAELVRSRAVLEEGLGRPVEVFSFPYGDDGREQGSTGDALRRAGYRAACLYGGGPNRLPLTEAYRLTRLAMGPDTDLGAVLAEGGRA
jgi:peptidoglycan/xylan/chitin deacetylase (PgdA/CDA1 family)